MFVIAQGSLSSTKKDCDIMREKKGKGERRKIRNAKNLEKFLIKSGIYSENICSAVLYLMKSYHIF